LPDYSSLSLKDLVCMCGDSNDSRAWDELLSRLERPITLSIIHTLYRKRGEALRTTVEDLRQDVYFKLLSDRLQALRDFAELQPALILAYVKKMAINKALDWIKYDDRRPVDPIIDTDPPSPGPHPDRGVLLGEVQAYLRECAAGRDQQRDMLIFNCFNLIDLSAQEIAELPSIHLTESGVESALRRLMKCVREKMVRRRLNKGETG
jgi:DNA-directed RNA polymerase specialized sigma24 family protein